MGNLTDPPDALFTLDEEDPARPPRDERPVDLRDEVESDADDMRPGDPDATFMGESETPAMGPYPPPPLTERPHSRAVALAGVVAWLLAPPRWRVPALLGAGATAGLLMGYARVALNVHWPTDALGGVLLGLGWAALSACLVR